MYYSNATYNGSSRPSRLAKASGMRDFKRLVAANFTASNRRNRVLAVDQAQLIPMKYACWRIRVMIGFEDSRNNLFV